MHRRLRLPLVVGLAMLTVFVGWALFAPLLAPFSPAARAVPYAHPSAAHWLGTDDVGHDLLTQLMYGARASLEIGFGVGVVAMVVAGAVAAVAGLTEGLAAAVVMRFADVVLAVPFLPLVLVAAAFLGRSPAWEIALLAAVLWARPARILRAEVLTAKRRGHVEAAVSMGVGQVRVFFRHISHYVAPLVIPLFIRTAMLAVLVDASLAFLGVGDPSRISWGTMLYWADARNAVLTNAWLWWVVPPGLAIAGLVVALGLVGLWVEERINPSLARSGGVAALD